MGMPVTIHVCDRGATSAALDDAYADFEHLDQLFSPFLETSATSRINRGELTVDDADELVRQVFTLCRMYEVPTEGYFSCFPRGGFDPSGLVKGWAIDRAASILGRFGFRNFFVDAAGDVLTRGVNDEGLPWRVGIRNPYERNKVARVVLASDLAVATSGTYEKGHHIVDPHTGRSADELISLTVIGPDILLADVYATAAFAMGARAISFIERVPSYEGYAIKPDATANWTTGFDAFCDRPRTPPGY
jgi:thiamine biosynthesis lipoprotein